MQYRLYQVTAISHDGTRYPVGWHADYQEARRQYFDLKAKWAAVIIHEVESVMITGATLLPRSEFSVNGNLTPGRSP